MLVLVSVGVATAIAVPLGIALTPPVAWQRPVLAAGERRADDPEPGALGLLIPIPLFGIGTRTALFAR